MRPRMRCLIVALHLVLPVGVESVCNSMDSCVAHDETSFLQTQTAVATQRVKERDDEDDKDTDDKDEKKEKDKKTEEAKAADKYEEAEKEFFIKEVKRNVDMYQSYVNGEDSMYSMYIGAVPTEKPSLVQLAAEAQDLTKKDNDD